MEARMRWRRNEIVGHARKVAGLWVLRPQRINDEADNAEPDDGDDYPEMEQSANKVHTLSPAKRGASSPPKKSIQARAIRVAFFVQGCGRSGEQRRAGFLELYVGAALAHPEPSSHYRNLEAGAVFGREPLNSDGKRKKRWLVLRRCPPETCGKRI
jgi:hypothetical protein